MRSLLFLTAFALSVHMCHGEEDPLLRGLDLSRLQPLVRAERDPSGEEDRALFTEWEVLPEVLRKAELPQGDEPEEFLLPAGSLLVVANPAKVSDAYRLLAETLKETELTPVPPLFLVIHADDRVSLGCRVEGDLPGPVPMGVYVTPQPGRRLLTLPVEASEATRRDPALPAATGRLRREITTRGMRAETRELILLLGADNTVLLGLWVDNP